MAFGSWEWRKSRPHTERNDSWRVGEAEPHYWHPRKSHWASTIPQNGCVRVVWSLTLDYGIRLGRPEVGLVSL